MQFCSFVPYFFNPNHLVILLVAMLCYVFYLFWNANGENLTWTSVTGPQWSLVWSHFPHSWVSKMTGLIFVSSRSHVLSSDATDWLVRGGQSFDVIFSDWPRLLCPISAEITLYHLMEKPKNRVEWRWVCSRGKELRGTQRCFSTIRVAPGGY